MSQLLCLRFSHISYMPTYNIFPLTVRPILNGACYRMSQKQKKKEKKRTRFSSVTGGVLWMR